MKKMKNNKQRNAILLFILVVFIVILLVVFAYSYYSFINDDDFNPETDINETISIANWNLQIFGDMKANNTELMDLYSSKVSKYDIVFLQEIRDKDGSSFKELCAKIPDYNCAISSRAGRSSSKEQYGIVYLKKFNMTIMEYNPDVLDRWERPPIRVDFIFKNYSFTAYNIHTKPDDVHSELKNLETLIDSQNNNRNIVVIGDLNADCNYYDRYSSSDFVDWIWIISNDADTTSGNSKCAYDRIIMNPDAYNEFIVSGIDFSDITEKVSDHYLVWALLRGYEYQKDKTFKAYVRYLSTWP